MQKKIIYFLAGLALALSAGPAFGQSTAAATTSPGGLLQLCLPAGKTTYLSLPLTAAPVYKGVVSGNTYNTITVATNPAPFTSSLTAPGAPYFVEFLTGNEAGRIMLITANTTSSLTVDICDGQPSWMSVWLTTSGFNVQAGDTFEIFPGDTLASIFGAGSTSNPLMLTGGTSSSSADQVTLLKASCLGCSTYYFNTAAGYWEQTGSSANANDTIIYPYQPMTIARPSGERAVSLVLSGVTATVKAKLKMISTSWGSCSTHYAVGVKLSQLNFGSNWTKGNSGNTADSVDVWNPVTNTYDAYFQKADLTWHLVNSPAADQSSFVIPAGSALCLYKNGGASGAGDFVDAGMPYTVN